RGRKAWIGEREAVLLRRQVELAAELLLTQQRALQAAERAVQRLGRRRVRGMLPPRDEVRPERNAQRAVAPHRAAFALPLRERLRARRGGRWIREQRVPRHDE